MYMHDLLGVLRLLPAAKRDRNNRFRESYELSYGRRVLCESRSEYAWWEEFTKALEEHRKQGFHNLSFKTIFESIVKDGREMVASWNPSYGPDSGAGLVEAAGAITTSDFSNITGQIVYNELIRPLTPEDYPFQSMIRTQSTPFDGEKIAGIAGLGDVAEIVPERQEFPLVGVTEDFIETPSTKKRGLRVALTKEALFFDRTSQLLSQASDVGKSLIINKEKRAIDCIIDENTTAHRYKWRGTTYASYQTTTPWDNVTASNALLDWTDVDAADQTFNSIVDPNTGEPVVVMGNTLICAKGLEQTALRIRNATEITVVTPGYAVSANPNETRAPNPFGGKFNVVSSRLFASRLATDTDWFYGDPSEYARYMENWPITVSVQGAGSDDEHKRDIITSYRGSERGAYSVTQPRVMQKSTVA